MRRIENEVREEAGQRAKHHDRRCKPVTWRDAQQAVLEEGARRLVPVLADDDHDEAADDKEDIDAGSTDRKILVGPFRGVEEHGNVPVAKPRPGKKPKIKIDCAGLLVGHLADHGWARG